MPTFGGTGVGGYGGSLGWSVGNLQWLNSPNSKVNRYWRVQEYGSNATNWPWQGQRVVGLWGPNAGPRRRLISGDLSAFQSGRNNQKFVPFFRSIDQADQRRAARAALYYFFGGGKGKNMELLNVNPSSTKDAKNRRDDVDSNRKRIYFWLMTRARVEDMPFVQGVIIREVQAGHYYARAIQNMGGSGGILERELAELRRVMAHVYGAGGQWADPKTTAGLRKTRQAVADDASGRSGWTTEYAPKTGARRREKQRHSRSVRGRYIATVDASVYVQDNIRTSRGTISQYVSEMSTVNRNLAERFQEEVVQLMQQERRRPVSGDLVKAHRDPRNRTP
jgi:hypothetical protein